MKREENRKIKYPINIDAYVSTCMYIQAVY